MYWQGWSEMGHISAEYVIQLISYYYIYGKLDHIYPEKQQDNSKKDNGSKHMEGVMQGEGILDKIGIAYWMSLPNTPILWTTSVTNCRILSQEICFRGSQYHKCSLWVSGSHSIANFTFGFCKTIWNLVKSLKGWLLDKHDKWLALYFNINPVPPITYWWIWMPLQGGSKSPLVHTLEVVQHDQHSLAC